MEHQPSESKRLTNIVIVGTPVGGQFGWGGTPSRRYRGRPKVDSGGSGIHRRGQGQKSA